MAVIDKAPRNEVQPYSTSQRQSYTATNPTTATKTATYDDQGAQRARVTLTAAQVKALNTTPITLVAAPGAGMYVSVIEVLATLNYGTTQFTGANNVELRYTNGSGAKVTGDLASSWLNGSATAAVKAIAAAVTPVANAAVVAAVPVANPGAGDSTVSVDIYYRVVKLP